MSKNQFINCGKKLKEIIKTKRKLIKQVNTIAFGPSGDGPYIGGNFGEVDSDTTLKKLAKYIERRNQ